MILAYARVSTAKQSLDLQLDDLKLQGVADADIFTDVVSGAKSARPGLDALDGRLSEGDVVMIWKLDRLGRSFHHLVNLVMGWRSRGIELVSLRDGIDTRTPVGRFFFNILAALAEMERELIQERVIAGIEAARARGRIGGRRPKVDQQTLETIAILLDQNMPRRQIWEQLGISKATFYRWLPLVPS